MKVTYTIHRANYDNDITRLRESAAESGLARMVGGILDVQCLGDVFFASEILAVHVVPSSLDKTPEITFILQGGYSAFIPAPGCAVILRQPR